MHDFTPIPALIGGLLIGLASAWLLWANGRVAGVSGILFGALSPITAAEGRWRIAFIAGLVAAGLVYGAATGAIPARSGFPVGWLVLAGLLVGFGTRMGGGCTSGHGVCGLGRLSLRSLVAVLVFMGAGMAATYVMRHLLGVGA